MIKAGVREGRLEGEARILGRHLIHGFGLLSDMGEQRLAAATETELEVWTDTVLVANSLAEVFAPPSANDARHAEPAWIHLTVAGRRLSPRPWQTGYPVAWAGWRMRFRQGRAPDRPVGHIRAEREAVPPSRDAH